MGSSTIRCADGGDEESMSDRRVESARLSVHIS